MWCFHPGGYKVQWVFREAFRVVTFVLGVKGERIHFGCEGWENVFTGRDDLSWKKELQGLSEVLGMCSWAQGPEMASGKLGSGGLWGEWGQGRCCLGFIGPGDSLKVERIMLVVWNGKGEGLVKVIDLRWRCPVQLRYTGRPSRRCGFCSTIKWLSQ